MISPPSAASSGLFWGPTQIAGARVGRPVLASSGGTLRVGRPFTEVAGGSSVRGGTFSGLCGGFLGCGPQHTRGGAASSSGLIWGPPRLRAASGASSGLLRAFSTHAVGRGPLSVRVDLINRPPRLFCVGVSWGRVWVGGGGGNNKFLAVSGVCSSSSINASRIVAAVPGSQSPWLQAKACSCRTPHLLLRSAGLVGDTLAGFVKWLRLSKIFNKVAASRITVAVQSLDLRSASW